MTLLYYLVLQRLLDIEYQYPLNVDSLINNTTSVVKKDLAIDVPYCIVSEYMLLEV